jgi:purine-nucleoside phosphorylase
MSDDPYASAAAAAEALRSLTGVTAHDAAVVLGSGWRPAADALGTPDAEIPTADLGGFPETTVPGHIPVVRSVAVGGARVLVFLGRTHLYEGYGVNPVVHGVRMAVAAGCQVVVLTNASGGIRAGLAPGQPVLISDQLNLTAQSPLTGPPPPEGYPGRFTDLSDLYAARLRAVARAADPELEEGVYAAMPGPHYESPAEIRMLRTGGADLVGMSTALEAIAARHLGAEVLGISLVTNIAAGLSDQPLDHTDVLATGLASATRMGALLAEILPGLTAP